MGFFFAHLWIKLRAHSWEWEQKISENKDHHCEGLCHILLLLPFPVRGQQRRVVPSSDWSSRYNNSADWLKDCRSGASILNINTSSSSLFSQKPGAVREGVRCAAALWQEQQLCCFRHLAGLNQSFTPRGTAKSLPNGVSDQIFGNVFLNCC